MPVIGPVRIRASITTESPVRTRRATLSDAGERPAEVLLGQADRVVVVRIPCGDDPLVLGLDRVGSTVPGEARAAVMEHQNLVGDDV